MIGLFDSGSGGLSILRACQRALPLRSFVYLGDHRNAPYGDKKEDEIRRLTIVGLETLFALGCDSVIIACNTAAVDHLARHESPGFTENHSDRIVFDVVRPVIDSLIENEVSTLTLGSNRTSVVLVFATMHTVASNVFDAHIRRVAPRLRTVQIACPLLVPMIERQASHVAIRTAVRNYVREAIEAAGECQIDACILGCTHYELISDVFAELLPRLVRIISQPDLVAAQVRRILKDDIGRNRLPVLSTTAYYTTGDPGPVSKLASDYLGRPIEFALV